MPEPSRDRLTRTLHWLTVLLVAIAWTLGDDPRDSPSLFGVHMGIGLIVLAVTLPRLLWRGMHRAPPLPGPDWMQRLAHGAHAALYALLLAVPALGAAAIWARGQPLHLFWLVRLPSPWSPNRYLAGGLEGLHVFTANLLLVVVLLHVAAALYHQWVLQDGLLARMRLPWRR